MVLQAATVDRHPLIAQALGVALAAQPDIDLAWTATGEAGARAAFRSERCAVVVVGDRLADGTATALIGALRAAPSPPGTVVVSGLDDPVVALDALEAGADAVVRRDRELHALVSAVRRAAAGVRTLDPAVPERVAGGADAAALRALSGREVQVLELVAGGATAEDIAEALHVSVHTARNHLRAIRSKLGVESVAAAVAVGFRRGLL